jgi:Kef-type K+ transport system membrane component KefB
LLALSAVLIAAKLGSDLAERVGQPALLTELVCGVVLENLSFVGFSGLEYRKSDSAVGLLDRFGA